MCVFLYCSILVNSAVRIIADPVEIYSCICTMFQIAGIIPCFRSRGSYRILDPMDQPDVEDTQLEVLKMLKTFNQARTFSQRPYIPQQPCILQILLYLFVHQSSASNLPRFKGVLYTQYNTESSVVELVVQCTSQKVVVGSVAGNLVNHRIYMILNSSDVEDSQLLFMIVTWEHPGCNETFSSYSTSSQSILQLIQLGKHACTEIGSGVSNPRENEANAGKLLENY